jgi:hypothetical protein
MLSAALQMSRSWATNDAQSLSFQISSIDLTEIQMTHEVPRLGPRVAVDDTPGYLFRARTSPGYCFVPQHCFRGSAEGVTFDELRYIAEGWARVNGSINVAVVGHRLFPDLRAPVRSADDPRVSLFIHSLSRAAFV